MRKRDLDFARDFVFVTGFFACACAVAAARRFLFSGEVLMSTALRVDVDTKAVQAALKRLAPWGEKVAADTLQRVAFEVMADIKIHVGSTFNFSGPSTKSFLSGNGSWKFDRITPKNLTTKIYPSGSGKWSAKRFAILSQHTKRAASLTAQSAGRLHASRASADTFAAPVKLAIKRGTRGKIRSRELPSAMLRKDAFISRSGRAIVQRTGPKQYRVAYALMQRAENPRKLDIHSIALKTCKLQFPRKAARAIAKARPR